MEDWIQQINLLETKDGFDQKTIQKVFDSIFAKNLLDSMIIDLGTLRQKNKEGETLFELLMQKVQEDTNSTVVKKDLTKETNKTGFAQVEDYFKE
ncbi:MAG: hypothetical protein GXP45_00230 [bacterium]|nr:hypothetical protein [bacterium]